ncbi:MAG: hypothetical protein WC838_07575 [Candidatus Margulisiibacteriota bacterium]
MTTLTAAITRGRAIETEKAIWAVGSVLMAAVAINLLPIVSGVVAFYSAAKAESLALKSLAVIAAISGTILGVMAAL